MQPWTSKFAQGFDMFFDPFSNCLTFFKEGYFVIWDQFDRQMLGTNQAAGATSIVAQK
jgi:hypothetical protein